MPYYTEEQIKAVRSIDLLTYLQTYEPTELIHVRGNTYCTREHDSLKISSDGRWYWWSRGFGGYSALDYLIKVKGMQFMDAMKILSGERQLPPKYNAALGENRHCEGKRKLLLPERSETNLESRIVSMKVYCMNHCLITTVSLSGLMRLEKPHMHATVQRMGRD